MTTQTKTLKEKKNKQFHKQIKKTLLGTCITLFNTFPRRSLHDYDADDDRIVSHDAPRFML